jgi:sugar lactone lactonase YvrE
LSQSNTRGAGRSDNVQCVWAANAILGEGPIWDAAAQCLYWIDIKRPAIYRFEPARGQTGVWPLPKPVGCITPAADGRFVLADENGFAWLDAGSGELTRIADPEPEHPENRFNDGKVDRAGRFWAGTLYEHEVREAGSLYRLDRDLTVTKWVSGLGCPNGIGWSPDNRTLYFTDSVARTIWAYEYDLATGDLGARRDFAKLDPGDGVPDGLTVDREGGVWSCVWDGWRIIRYTPDGAIEREIRMPVQRPTSCMFGGASLDTLYVTSASGGLQGALLAGGLFAVHTGVSGLAETPFGRG